MAIPTTRWSVFGLLIVGLLPGDSGDLIPTPAPRVVGLPPGHNAAAYVAPYTGPHPSRLIRPADPFPFPLRLGDVGPAAPLFAGPRKYPFACDTEASGLGPPEVDNQAGIGTPVIAHPPGWRPAFVAGYSQDCLAKTRARYFYKPIGQQRFAPWTPETTDVAHLSYRGIDVPFVVRVETGTINRFIYTVVALRGADESLDNPRPTYWNGRLIYQFFGGVGIGYRQGKADVHKLLDERSAQLAQGYAVVASTGNASTNHFDLWLAEDTALRVKRQFAALYGEPDYTIGVGGSGGAIQQYLLAQNRPGLIDAAIAQYAYPDMITQTIPVFDCELLEHFFDVTDRTNPLWQTAAHRQWIEGFRADANFRSSGKIRKIERLTQLSALTRGEWPRLAQGQTECVVGWRGLTPLVLNPRFVYFADRFSPALVPQVHWSYFDDLKRVFGTDPAGFARIPWDNVGVQYGLQALRNGQITPTQFLTLNARVGSWKPVAQMTPERFWTLAGAPSALPEFSPWSAHNMHLGSPPNDVAPRHAGDLHAIAAAYRSGQVFLGRLDIPTIDVRHYLDPDLNMHHASGSFSVRERLLAGQGHADNHAIWIADKNYDPTGEAFVAIEEWLQARHGEPTRPWADVRPTLASDRCFDAHGDVLAAGEDVWDGAWNQRPTGACLQAYPVFGTPRTAAGDSLHGDRFKCALQPVTAALTRGVYGPVDMRPYRGPLEQIFPHGVCDYTQPDAGRPRDVYAGDPQQEQALYRAATEP